MSGVLFYGDPHGLFQPLRDACALHQPEAVVLLGDCELARPLHEALADLVDAGIGVFWVPGNHDTDTEEWHDRLFLSRMSDGNLHGRVADVAGLRIGGLGGVFRGKVWRPGDEGQPRFRSRREYLRSMPRNQHWRPGWFPGDPTDGLPLKQRSTIFPDDVEALAALAADVLVTHEAPSSHEHGQAEIAVLASRMGARLIVHGHHHRSYESVLPSGVRVRGLGLAEPWLVDL